MSIDDSYLREVLLEGSLPEDTIVVKSTTATVINIPVEVSSRFFSAVTTQVLKNPQFETLFRNSQEICIRGGLSLGGSQGLFSLNGHYLGTTLSGNINNNPEIKEFFQTLGRQFHCLNRLELEHLTLPLSLFNNLLRHAPQQLKSLHFHRVQILPEENDLQSTSSAADLVSILKRLPDLDSISTYYQNSGNHWDHMINKHVALDLVKSSVVFENRTKMIMVADQMEIGVDDFQLGGGIWLCTDRMLLAIAALQNNNRLQILEIPKFDTHYESLLVLQQTVAPVFAQALTEPRCNVLDTLKICAGDVYSSSIRGGAAAASPGPLLLTEIGNFLPQLKVRKLVVEGPEDNSSFHQELIQKQVITMERLSNNHWLEEMQFVVYQEQQGRRGRRFFRRAQIIEFSNKHQLHLKVNRFHNRAFGTARNDFIANPENVSPEKWLILFQALVLSGEEEEVDLDCIYYYYHMYTTKADTANLEDYHLGKSKKKSPSPPQKKKAKTK